MVTISPRTMIPIFPLTEVARVMNRSRRPTSIMIAATGAGIMAFASPAFGQAPIRKLLDKIPSLVGEPRQPSVALPVTPVLPGITRAAAATSPGDVASYDLGGFRLGMSEREIEAVAASRRLKPTRVVRVVDFETQVRGAVNVRGGAGGRATGRSVLGEVTFTDDAGGRYMLRTTVWPDGAHLNAVTYIAPPGTPTAEWRRLLVGKWGQPSTEEGGASLAARWTGGSAGARAGAAVGPRGGEITMETAEGTRSRPVDLIERTVDGFFAANARRPSL